MLPGGYMRNRKNYFRGKHVRMSGGLRGVFAFLKLGIDDVWLITV